MTINFLITIACLVGFVYSILKESVYSKIANGLMLLGMGLLIPVMLAKIKIENYVGIAMFIFFIGAIGLIILHMIEKNTSGSNKILILFLGLFGISPWFCRMMHWPGSIHLLLSFLPLLFLIITLVNRKINTNQMLSGLIVFSSFCAINVGVLLSYFFE